MTVVLHARSDGQRPYRVTSGGRHYSVFTYCLLRKYLNGRNFFAYFGNFLRIFMRTQRKIFSIFLRHLSDLFHEFEGKKENKRKWKKNEKREIVTSYFVMGYFPIAENAKKNKRKSEK